MSSSIRPLCSPCRSSIGALALATVGLFLIQEPASAQASKALVDAPLVVADSQNRIMLTLDYDQDGYEDAVGYWWEDDFFDKLMFHVWLNDGTGQLVRTYTSSVAGDIAGPSAEVKFLPADLNGDSLPDFVAIFNEPNSAKMYGLIARAGMQPIFAGGVSYNEPIGGVVYFPKPEEPDKSLRVMLNGDRLQVHCVTQLPSGAISSSVCGSYTFPATPDFLGVDDWDGDGKGDLFVNAAGSGYLFLLDQADGSLFLIGDHPHGLTDDPMVVMGDIDGDGDQDVVAFEDSQYAVLRRTNINRFVPELPQIGGPATHLADIDGDGDLDGACCGGGGGASPDPVHNDGPSMFQLSINDGTGAFAPAFGMPGLGAVHLAGAVDLDQNGHLDLVAGRAVYYSQGPINAATLPQQVTPMPVNEVLADIDGDGDTDLGLGLLFDARNMGDGMLATGAPWVGAAPAGARFSGPGVFGDFDGDGDQDVVAPLEDLATNTLIGMRLLANNGGGGFEDHGDAGALPPGYDLSDFSQVSEALAADADGDGDIDIVWPEAVNTSICSHVYWNDGAGVFQPGPVFWVERVLDVADFTGDGIPDLLVGNFTFNDGRLWIRAGLGGAAFANRDSLGFFDYTSDVVDVADYDADGDLDIVHSREGNSIVSIRSLTNNGDGSFVAQFVSNPAFYGDDSGDFKLALDDLTGDGLPDLIVGPMQYAMPAVSIVPRAPDGLSWLPTFQAPKQLVYEVAGPNVIVPMLKTADLDGDGDVDLNTGLLVRGAVHSGSAAGTRRQLSDGVAAASGMVPTLGATGPFRVGEQVTLRLQGAPGQVAGVLEIVHKAAPPAKSGGSKPGVSAQQPTQVPLFLDFTTAGLGREPGSGTWTRSFTVTPGMAGQSYKFRAHLVDPSTGLETVASNTLVLTYGD